MKNQSKSLSPIFLMPPGESSPGAIWHTRRISLVIHSSAGSSSDTEQEHRPPRITVTMFYMANRTDGSLPSPFQPHFELIPCTGLGRTGHTMLGAACTAPGIKIHPYGALTGKTWGSLAAGSLQRTPGGTTNCKTAAPDAATALLHTSFSTAHLHGQNGRAGCPQASLKRFRRTGSASPPCEQVPQCLWQSHPWMPCSCCGLPALAPSNCS